MKEKMRNLEEAHSLAMKRLRAVIETIRDECPHEKKRLCLGTPYDHSYYTCEICGKDDV